MQTGVKPAPLESAPRARRSHSLALAPPGWFCQCRAAAGLCPPLGSLAPGVRPLPAPPPHPAAPSRGSGRSRAAAIQTWLRFWGRGGHPSHRPRLENVGLRYQKEDVRVGFGSCQVPRTSRCVPAGGSFRGCWQLRPSPGVFGEGGGGGAAALPGGSGRGAQPGAGGAARGHVSCCHLPAPRRGEPPAGPAVEGARCGVCGTARHGTARHGTARRGQTVPGQGPPLTASTARVWHWEHWCMGASGLGAKRRLGKHGAGGACVCACAWVCVCMPVHACACACVCVRAGAQAGAAPRHRRVGSHPPREPPQPLPAWILVIFGVLPNAQALAVTGGSAPPLVRDGGAPPPACAAQARRDPRVINNRCRWAPCGKPRPAPLGRLG